MPWRLGSRTSRWTSVWVGGRPKPGRQCPGFRTRPAASAAGKILSPAVGCGALGFRTFQSSDRLPEPIPSGNRGATDQTGGCGLGDTRQRGGSGHGEKLLLLAARKPETRRGPTAARPAGPRSARTAANASPSLPLLSARWPLQASAAERESPRFSPPQGTNHALPGPLLPSPSSSAQRETQDASSVHPQPPSPDPHSLLRRFIPMAPNLPVPEYPLHKAFPRASSLHPRTSTQRPTSRSFRLELTLQAQGSQLLPQAELLRVSPFRSPDARKPSWGPTGPPHRAPCADRNRAASCPDLLGRDHVITLNGTCTDVIALL